ncbi:MAG: metallophosphoesterase [Bacteroidales bacterium]|nr:metallophosphoesterase [Bacteroidales bacterium]
MLILLVVLMILEVLTFLTLSEFFSAGRRPVYFFVMALNFSLSIWVWILFIRTATYQGFFDEPRNVTLRLNLAWVMTGIIIPRFILTALHFTGRLFRIRKKGFSKLLTGTGIYLAALAVIVLASGSMIGRFRLRTEEVNIRIRDLDPRLEGLTIVHISDLHLASFHRHHRFLERVTSRINSLKPGLIINTGDFVSYGWREFERFDTTLAKARSEYGNLAVLGNHDMGTYIPDISEADRKANIENMKELIRASGYRLLDNESITININGADVDFTGVETAGRFPEMIHTDITEATRGTDSSGLEIILLHDPNQWRKEVAGHTGIELALAGHTHGMQIGILTKRIRWSPAKYIYPEWNGLFTEGDQQLYVNRGLGAMGIPARIWMPPELTVLTLSRK